MHFNRGHLVPENSIFLDPKVKYAMMGVLNGTYLEEAEMVDLEEVAEYQCIPVIKIPPKGIYNRFALIKCPIALALCGILLTSEVKSWKSWKINFTQHSRKL